MHIIINANMEFEFPINGQVTDEMKSFYEQHGFVIFNNYLTAEECDDLLSEGSKLISEFEPTPETLAIFHADTESGMKNTSQYFRDSADKISFFFEKDAFLDGKLVVDKNQSINKIAHALGELNTKFADVTLRESIKNIAQNFGVSDPVLVQSMMICKPKKIGGEVKPHQDSTFLYTKPDTTMAFWIPLERTTVNNACLYAIPGSHKLPLMCRYINNEKGSYLTDLQGQPLTDEETKKLYQASCHDNEFIPLEMNKGSLLIFPGTLIHRSGPNPSEQSRNAYTFHLVSANSVYDQENWLQRSTFRQL